jgi:tRNA(fMet)-specific endonuclease VapC
MDAVFMLDTNILSDAIRNPFGRTRRYIDHFDERAICTSAIVASEMRYGARKKGSARLIERIELTLEWVNVLPYDDEASRTYGIIRSELEKQGRPIGWGDLFIAAHAKSLGLTLVTNNVREFSRVDGLKIENWLEEEAGS